MGWWKTGTEDDWMGDGPADWLGVALDEMAERRRAAGGVLPTRQQLVDALEDLLRSKLNARLWFADARPPAGRVVARFAAPLDGATVGVPGRSDLDLFGSLATAVTRLARDFETGPPGRKPRVREVLHALQCVIPVADAYLSDAQGADLVALTVEPIAP
jgi:hypothetical protein